MGMISLATVAVFVAILAFFIVLPVMGVISFDGNTTTINTTKLIINSTEFVPCLGYSLKGYHDNGSMFINTSTINGNGRITICDIS